MEAPSHRSDDAINALRASIAREPLDCESIEALRQIYQQLGRQAEEIEVSHSLAEAYLQMGQASAAMFEYENILRRFPADARAQRALHELQSGSNKLAGALPEPAKAPLRPALSVATTSEGLSDGREIMHSLFTQSHRISSDCFWRNWPGESHPLVGPVKPFIQRLAEQQIMPVADSLDLISEKCRLPILSLDHYEFDAEIARQYAHELCWRWCVLPFDRMSQAIFVATTNPFNLQAAEALAQSKLSQGRSYRTVWYLAPPEQLMRLLDRLFAQNEYAAG